MGLLVIFKKKITLIQSNRCSVCYYSLWGARGVLVIVVGNVHGDTSSNPGQD